MSFDTDRCIIKGVYCGDGNIPLDRAKYYSGLGTRNQCMKKGFGAGMATERRKTLPANSLQNISYVGDVMEQNLIQNGIKNLDDLKVLFKGASKDQMKIILKNSLINKNGVINKKAYNSVLMYLYNSGLKNLPKCKKN